MPAKIIIEGGPEALSRAAARLVAGRCAKAVDDNGFASLVLSGGRTPEGVYRVLAADKSVPWDRVHLFWGDERCVGPTDPRSNYRLALDSLISKIEMPSGNVHRMKGELDPVEAARLYDEEVRGFFKIKAGEFPEFDIVLLGLGPDGHTLSLFPSTKALEEKKRVAVENRLKTGEDRITLSFPAVNNSRCAAFIVSGEDKAAMVSEVLGKKGDYPACRIRPKGDLIWLIDNGAGGRLSDIPGRRRQ